MKRVMAVFTSGKGARHSQCRPVLQPAARALIGAALVVGAATAQAQSWTPLVHAAPGSIDEMNLLTDGSVLAHHADFTANDDIWYRLTPDAFGNYANGTWTQVTRMPNGYAPIDFASAVLPDGRLIVEGGEYQAGVETETNLGAIYDPRTNVWTAISPPSGWSTTGDAPSAVLPNGTFMLGESGSATKAQALFNAANLSWTPTGTNKFDANAEEGWTLLPNGKVLTIDAYFGQYNPTGTGSELYDPATGSWSSAGSTVAQIWDSAAACGGSSASSYEVGPMALRPDGTVFATGANTCGAGHTAIYDSTTGTWRAGPDFPQDLSAGDAPAATETNGNVIVYVSPKVFGNGGQFFEWNGSTLTSLPLPTSTLNSEASYYGKMLLLPSGQILFTHYNTDAYLFNPAGTYQSAWRPTVTAVSSSLAPGQTYTLSGTQLNGLTQGAWYGDDAASATNYPIVRLVNNATGHVFYCRTHDHSTMAVATGSRIVSTSFDVPSNVETGAAQLYVVANGIPSTAVAVTVGAGGAVSLSPSSLSFGNVAVGTTSGAQNVTLTNGTGASVSVTSVAVNGAFAQNNNCGTLAAGTSCTISVTFKPTATGTASGTLTVTDTVGTQTESLSGSGVSGGSNVTLSPASYTFGTVAVNGYSSWKAFTLSNAGSSAITVGNVAISGPFQMSSYCSGSLAAGANCTVWVLFAPKANGVFSGQLSVSDSAGTQTASVSGTGGTGGSSVTLSPASYDFGSIAVGSYSNWKAFVLTNTGSASVSVGSASVSGPFYVSNACGASLAPGANCNVWVLFGPTARGGASGTLNVSAGGGTQSSALSGTGT